MKRLLVLVALAALAVTTGGCRFDSWLFYDVTRTPADVCEIRAEGEFCDPDLKPPPENEGWSIERVGDQVRLYIDDDVWLAEENKDDPNKLTATKVEVVTADPGPCTTTHTQKLSSTDDAQTIKGTLEDKVRITGDEDCGEVPRGSRDTFDISGKFSGSP